jgi:hypothetical protein
VSEFHEIPFPMIQSPSDFFAQNGGAALLEANGSEEAPSLTALLAKQWPVWPKDGETSPTGKKTRPGTAPVSATLVVSSDGVILRSAANLKPTNFATIGKGLVENKIYELAWSLMDLPRPVLMTVAGAAYKKAITTARLTLDPNIIECFGDVAFVLDRERVNKICDFSGHFGKKPSELRALRGSVEYAIAHPGSGNSSTRDKRTFKHPNHPAIVKQARKDLGLSGKMTAESAESDLEALSDYWRDVAALPPVSDPAWHIAEQLINPKKKPKSP